METVESVARLLGLLGGADPAGLLRVLPGALGMPGRLGRGATVEDLEDFLRAVNGMQDGFLDGDGFDGRLVLEVGHRAYEEARFLLAGLAGSGNPVTPAERRAVVMALSGLAICGTVAGCRERLHALGPDREARALALLRGETLLRDFEL